MTRKVVVNDRMQTADVQSDPGGFAPADPHAFPPSREALRRDLAGALA
jgi:hypothetical protein